MNQMNRKFKYEQYEICVNFRNENCLTMSAEFLPTQEMFMKDDVQLTRIKKDTVFATLEKKSEHNLRCELQQIISDGKKYLLVSFLVSFDYLPEFKEQIQLEFVEIKEKLKSISVNNFHGEIQEMEKILNTFQKSGLTMHKQSPALANFSGGKQIWSEPLATGKYLLRVSAIYTNTTGSGAANDQITFTLQIPGNDKKKTVLTAFTQYGYPYPLSFSEIVQVQTEGDLKITAQASAASCSMSGSQFLLSPIVQLA